MTTSRQAMAELGKLHVTYCPLLDRLMMPDSTDKDVKEEQRQAERIWTLGKIAFGDAAGARLEMLKHGLDELAEIAHMLSEQTYRNEAHRLALIGCCVRSRRLGNLLETAKVQRVPDIMARAAAIYAEAVIEHGAPNKRGDKARLHKLVAERIGCPTDTVKKAVDRARKRTVPK